MVEGMWDGSVPRQFLSETRDNMWSDFLWAHDPMQPLNKQAMLNACFASGLVLARYVALEQMNPFKTMAAHFGARSRLVLFDSPIRLFTLRQLRDTMQNIQICWVADNVLEHPSAHDALLDCFARFGELASVAHASEVMNDQGSVQDSGEGLLAMNRTCLRRFLSVFLILFRHLHIQQAAQPVPSTIGDVEPTPIKKHHCAAASDDFGQLSMHWDLHPAARLIYFFDFTGMYNAISQVIFFHNPSYTKRMQERTNLEGLCFGDLDAVHIVPCMMQLYPEIQILHDDGEFNVSGAKAGQYHWLLCGHRVYLLTPKGPFYDPNVVVLLAYYQHVSKN